MVVIPIKTEIDVFAARRACRELARLAGFNSSDCALLEIAASELATNALKYAGGGVLRLDAADNGCLEIACEDHGPGIRDVPAALAGESKGDGLGIGLRGVRRIMDQLEIANSPVRGVTVTARKWAGAPPVSSGVYPEQRPAPANGLLEYGVVSLSRYGGAFNGDRFLIRELAGGALIALIDGLGHGEKACRVACQAVACVEAHCHEDPAAIIDRCHEELRRSRGAVMSVALIDLARERLLHAGVGNVGVRIAGGGAAGQPVSSPGIVGHSFDPLRQQEYPFGRRDTLFMFTDGIDPDPSALGAPSPEKRLQALVEELARAYGLMRDDGTMIAARPAVKGSGG